MTVETWRVLVALAFIAWFGLAVVLAVLAGRGGES